MKIIIDKINNLFVGEKEGEEIYLRYVIRNNEDIDFIYTYTPPELRGRSFAEEVVKFGFNYAKENNLKVIPTCPYIIYFLTKNEEYKSLLK